MKRFALIGVLLSVFVSAVLYADSLMIDFEAPAYHPGSIDGQNHWGGQNPPGIPINPLIDQEVVINNSSAPASFGNQSWRISNAYTSGSFGDMPFSPSLINEAGETQALNGNGVITFSGGTRQKHFEAQWAFTSADPNGGGTDCSPVGFDVKCSYLSMAPDRGDGARMSYIRLEDDFSGLRVFFDDYQDKAPYGSYGNPATAAMGCGPEDNFVETMVASGLDRTEAHTVKLAMDFVDGPRNDVVKVYVDGTLRHTGTSWEDYFRWCTESGGGTGTTAKDQSRTVDSMIFTVRGGQGETHPLNRGKGFLIDNLRLESSGNVCQSGDGDGDFADDQGHRHHGRFHDDSCENGGGRVEDDDADSGRHFESTSTDSATFTSNNNSKTLTMIGTGLDDGVPVGFTMVAVDNGGSAPAIYSLTLTNGRTFTGTLVSGSLVLQ